MTVRLFAAAALAATLAAALATPASAQGSTARHGLSDVTAVMLPEISVTYHRPVPADRSAGPHVAGPAGRQPR
ncbi:hypothetical protein [Methylobacterium sp. A52T]